MPGLGPRFPPTTAVPRCPEGGVFAADHRFAAVPGPVPICRMGPEGLEPSPAWLRARHAAANTLIPSLSVVVALAWAIGTLPPLRGGARSNHRLTRVHSSTAGRLPPPSSVGGGPCWPALTVERPPASCRRCPPSRMGPVGIEPRAPCAAWSRRLKSGYAAVTPRPLAMGYDVAFDSCWSCHRFSLPVRSNSPGWSRTNRRRRIRLPCFRYNTGLRCSSKSGWRDSNSLARAPKARGAPYPLHPGCHSCDLAAARRGIAPLPPT